MVVETSPLHQLPYWLAQKPRQDQRCKFLNPHSRKDRRFVAHKQMFVGGQRSYSPLSAMIPRTRSRYFPTCFESTLTRRSFGILRNHSSLVLGRFCANSSRRLLRSSPVSRGDSRNSSLISVSRNAIRRCLNDSWSDPIAGCVSPESREYRSDSVTHQTPKC